MEQKGKITQKILLFVIVLLGLVPVVFAQFGTNTALSKLSTSFQAVFGKIFLLPMLGIGFVFWAKFLIWLLLFTLLYAVAALVPTIGDKKNIRLVITMVIALISVIPMTEPLLRAIFQTYGVVTAFLLIAAPIVGMLYLLNKALPGDNPATARMHFALKAIAFFILGAIMQSLLNVQDLQFLPDFRNYGELGVGICFLLFWWYIIRAILAGRAEPEEAPQGGLLDRFRNLFGGGGPATPPVPPTPHPPGTPPVNTDHLTEDLNAIRDQIVQLQGMLPAFINNLNNLIGLHTNWALNPVTTDDDDIRDGYARLNEMRNDITNYHDTARNLFSQIRNDAAFGSLPNGEQNRYQQLMNAWWRMYHIFGRHMDEFYRRVEHIHRRGGRP